MAVGSVRSLSAVLLLGSEIIALCDSLRCCSGSAGVLALVPFMGCLSGWRGNEGEEGLAGHHVLGLRRCTALWLLASVS